MSMPIGVGCGPGANRAKASLGIGRIPQVIQGYRTPINNGGYQEGRFPRTALTQNQALWVLENYSGMIFLDC